MANRPSARDAYPFVPDLHGAATGGSHVSIPDPPGQSANRDIIPQPKVLGRAGLAPQIPPHLDSQGEMHCSIVAQAAE